jgi:hypothetical protein
MPRLFAPKAVEKVFTEKGATEYKACTSYGALDWNRTLDQIAAQVAAANAKKAAATVTYAVKYAQKLIRDSIKRLKREKKERIRKAREAKEKIEREVREKEQQEQEERERVAREAKEKADTEWLGATSMTRVWRSYKYCDRRPQLVPLREKYSSSGRRRAREALVALVQVLRNYFDVHDASELFAEEYPSDEELVEFLASTKKDDLEQLMIDTYGEGLEWFSKNHAAKKAAKAEREAELTKSRWGKIQGAQLSNLGVWSGGQIAEGLGEKGTLEKINVKGGRDIWDCGASSKMVLQRVEGDTSQGVSWKTETSDKGYAIGFSTKRGAPVKAGGGDGAAGSGTGGGGGGVEGGEGKGGQGGQGKGKGGKGKGKGKGKGGGGGGGGGKGGGGKGGGSNGTSGAAGGAAAPTDVSMIGFALHCNQGSFLSVHEHGKDMGVVVQYNPGDELSVKVEEDTVMYSRNDDVFYTSDLKPAFPLVVEVAFCGRGAKAVDIEMGLLV